VSLSCASLPSRACRGSACVGGVLRLPNLQPVLSFDRPRVSPCVVAPVLSHNGRCLVRVCYCGRCRGLTCVCGRAWLRAGAGGGAEPIPIAPECLKRFLFATVRVSDDEAKSWLNATEHGEFELSSTGFFISDVFAVIPRHDFASVPPLGQVVWCAGAMGDYLVKFSLEVKSVSSDSDDFVIASRNGDAHVYSLRSPPVRLKVTTTDTNGVLHTNYGIKLEGLVEMKEVAWVPFFLPLSNIRQPPRGRYFVLTFDIPRKKRVADTKLTSYGEWPAWVGVSGSESGRIFSFECGSLERGDSGCPVVLVDGSSVVGINLEVEDLLTSEEASEAEGSAVGSKRPQRLTLRSVTQELARNKKRRQSLEKVSAKWQNALSASIVRDVFDSLLAKSSN